MITIASRLRLAGLLLLAALTLAAWGCGGHNNGVSGTLGPLQPHRSFVQQHPTASSAAAGIAAYEAAKRTGANRVANGGKRNFMQRHPLITGLAAGAVAHHMIRKSQQNQ